jgi:hypothetical protein
MKEKVYLDSTVPSYREIFRRVACPHPDLVFAEGDIQGLVQAILDPPMPRPLGRSRKGHF